MTEKNQDKRSKNSFGEIMDLISQPVFVVDQRLLLVYANKAFEAVAGDKLNEITGKPLDQLTFFSQEVKVALAKMVGGILQGEKIESYEMSFSNDDDDGKTRFFESTGKIIDYFGQPASQWQTGGFCLGYWKRHQRRSFAEAVYALVHYKSPGNGFWLSHLQTHHRSA
jgi:PAS domain S-box-containing protein